MIARARVVAEQGPGGKSRITHQRSEAPLVLRATPEALYLVGGAAGPLGGDDLLLQIEVCPGARLTIRSVAASIALPDRSGAASRLAIEAEVGAGAFLDWAPEPLIAGKGCRHRTEAHVQAHSDARLIWREEYVLGRHGEDCGNLATRIDFEMGAAPMLRNELGVGPDSPGWDGPAVVGQAKALGSLLIAGNGLNLESPPPRVLNQNTTFLPLSGPALYVSVLAGNAMQLRHDLDAALQLIKAARQAC